MFFGGFSFFAKQSKQYISKIPLIISLFFTIIIPLIYFNNAEVDTRENRKLAEFKPLTTNKKINENFTKDFDNWISDRYGLREFFIKIQSIKEKINLFVQNEKTFLGYNGMLFYKEKNDGNSVYYAAGLIPRTPIKDILEKDFIKQFIAKTSNESKFVLIMAPAKSQVYPENYRILRNNYVKDYSDNFIISDKHIPLIHPLVILNNNKKFAKVFWNHDTHWTPFGACLAFSETAKLLKLHFETDSCSKWKEGNTQRVGDLDRMLPHGTKAPSMDHDFLNEEFNKATAKLKCTTHDNFVHCINPFPISEKTVIGIGDSQFYSTVFRNYVSLAYKESILMTRNVNTNDPQLLDLVKNADSPDFILEGAERYANSGPFEGDFFVLNKLLTH